MRKYLCEWEYTLEAKNKNDVVLIKWQSKERGVLTMEDILTSKLKLTILGAMEE